MLTTADNETLTRTGPGTPMGNLMRRYWVPPSPRSPAPDCPPLRVRLWARTSWPSATRMAWWA